MILNLLKKIKLLDTFGSTVYFKINGKDNYQTILGGFLNIIVMIVFICHFTFNFKKFIDKSDPDIYSVIKYDKSEIYGSTNDFLFNIELSFNNSNANETNIYDYFDLNASYYNKNYEEIILNFKRCNFNDYETKFISIRSKYMVCPDMKNLNHFSYDI